MCVCVRVCLCVCSLGFNEGDRGNNDCRYYLLKAVVVTVLAPAYKMFLINMYVPRDVCVGECL